MYTWGYIKDATLAKLDLTEEEASNQNLLSRFSFYANEALTQICSSVKPKNSYVDFEIISSFTVKDMPEDFIRFGDDINYYRCYKSYEDFDPLYMNSFREASDDEFVYYGYNKILFKKPGSYKISYDARWFVFNKSITDDVELYIPNDILDCLPSYIASQCFKIDDEVKSSIFRNEFEMAVARIDNTNYKNSKTFKLGGDWD